MVFVVIASLPSACKSSKKLAMFGHLLQVSCLSYAFGSAFKQFTLVSGYT